MPIRLATRMPGAYTYARSGDRLYFEAEAPIILRHVRVSPETSGEVTIELHESNGRLLMERTLLLEYSSDRRITLDFPLDDGGSYYLTYTGEPYLSVYDFSFPVTVPGVISITKSSTGKFCYFYDWECSVEAARLRL